MLITRLRDGALAGLIATVPMTIVMETLHRLLPPTQRYQLPPGQITQKITAELGLRQEMTQEQHIALTLLNHFGYGAAAGALYGPLANALPAPALIKGAAYGLIVWTVSYLGLLPAFGLLRPATQHPAPRNALMIVAHLVWGITIGLLIDRFKPGAK